MDFEMMCQKEGWVKKSEVKLRKKSDRSSEDFIHLIKTIEYPCENRISYTTTGITSTNTEFESSSSAICVSLIEEINKVGFSISSIDWKTRVLDMGTRLHNAWSVRTKRHNGSMIPHVEELFSIISKDSGYHYSTSFNGILSKVKNKSFQDRNIYDIEDTFKAILLNIDDFCIITIGLNTKLVWLGRDQNYYIFDPEGNQRVNSEDDMFYLSTNDIKNLVTIFLSLYYNEKHEEEPHSNINGFQAFKVWKTNMSDRK